MLKYAIRRIILMIPVLICVTLLLFFIQALAPGDPAVMVLGQEATEEAKEEWREENGLNQPLIAQYGQYIWNIVTQGDFGTSYSTGRSITETVMGRWPYTIVLAVGSILLATILGLFLGILSAVRRGKLLDSILRVIGIVLFSIPNFWLAIMLIIFFAMQLHWLPVSGLATAKGWVLPIMTMAMINAAGIMRFTRSAMLENLQQDFVRSVRAKGQSEANVVMRHVLGNSMIPIITYVGQTLISAMAGTIVLEQIFSLPGLGSLLIQAINYRDYPLLRGCVILIAITTAVLNLVIDLIYAFVDPRVKARFKNDASKSIFRRKKSIA